MVAYDHKYGKKQVWKDTKHRANRILGNLNFSSFLPHVVAVFSRTKVTHVKEKKSGQAGLVWKGFPAEGTVFAKSQDSRSQGMSGK